MSRLKKVFDRLGVSTMADFVAQEKRAVDVIEQTYDNAFTKRNIVTEVLSFYKQLPELKTAPAYRQWKAYHQALGQAGKTALIEQKAQAIALWKQHQPVYKMLLAQEKQPHASLDRSVRYLALLLNQIIPIKEFMNARYLVDVDIVPDKNCIVKTGQECMLYAQNERKKLSKKVTMALDKSFQAYPRQYIFVQSNSKPFTQTNKFMDLFKLQA